ncbi:LysR family transcriptional regulator [Mariluticola halotolerans]|uniref:LysR family transcriptional regulator n=1 Tax=Mariluticola halotolerans TaxID=2909283 RepID=UPI0026E39EA3|nr:LysR family transcriptional regulator [Mariluticola halotolerans]UJQ95092.1 LysR family transcriptional regulator [Mariluticola halotolerans]
MDLKDLRCVAMIAETGSFVAAAERLNMSQPSVSARIRRLEADLGTELFARSARGVSPTAQGEELLRHARSILRQMQDAEADMLAFNASPVGLVRVGLPTSLTAGLTSPLLELCMAEIPNVKLRIVESMSGYIEQWLQDGTLDLGITFGSRPPSDIVIEPLAREDLLLVGKDQAAMAPHLDTNGNVPFVSLANVPLILPAPEHGLRILVEDVARQQAVRLGVVVEIDAFGEIQRLVARGLGYTVMSSAAFQYGYRPDLAAALILRPSVSRVVNLTTGAGRTPSRAVSEVAQRLKSVVQMRVKEDGWLAHPII